MFLSTFPIGFSIICHIHINNISSNFIFYILNLLYLLKTILFLSTFFSSSSIVFISSIISGYSLFYLKSFIDGNCSSEDSKDSKAWTCFCNWCFSKAFSKAEIVNLACSIFFFFFFLLESNISSPARYSYLSILHDDKVDIFTVFVSITYCSFLSLILP